MQDAHGVELSPGDIITFIRPKNRDLELGRINRFTAEKIVMATPWDCNGKTKFTYTYLDPAVVVKMEPTPEILEKISRKAYI